MGQEGNIRSAIPAGEDVMEEDEALHPAPVGLLGSWTVMAGVQGPGQPVEKLGLSTHGWAGWVIRETGTVL
jgi:hypothetical protein